MANYITIDGGTTNTRVSLVCDMKILDVQKYAVGAKVGSENKILKNTVKDAVNQILSDNNLKESDITRILASGMITSEGGLCNLEHLVVPCGINELSSSMYETAIDEISSIPFVFVRGVKMCGETLEDTDMMRGEETELIGLDESLRSDCLYVMPGSHSKLVFTDSKGRISHFSTELTGELIAAVAGGTILNNSIDLKNSKPDFRALCNGYEYCKNHGMNSALFKVRILDKLLGKSSDEVFGFFLGVILAPEIENIINSNAKKVIICGKEELKTPTAMLVRKYCDKEVREVCADVALNAATIGIVRIFENKK